MGYFTQGSAADVAGRYNLKQFDFMGRAGPHMPVTDAYVSCPPALVIRDEEGAHWTLGFDYNETEWRSGKWEYDVVRNGRKTGAFARVIEFRRNKIIIYGSEGRRVWNGRQFV